MGLFDPLALVFIPGAAAMVAGMASPFVLLGHFFWRRRAKSRNRRAACGRCGASLVDAPSGSYLYFGIFICSDCADTLRRRLKVALPTLGGAVVVAGVISATGFLFGGPTAGGPGLDWWLNWRWFPLVLPSAGLGGASWLVIAHAKRRNRLEQGSATLELPPDEDVGALLEDGGR
jgi:hypothetical protein